MATRPVEEVVVALSSEQLAVSKRVVETGRVSIRIAASTSSTTVSEDLLSETAEVERASIGRFVDIVPLVREEGDVLVVPIVEERFVKRLFLREEVRISRRRETKAFSATADLRREDVIIERTDPEHHHVPSPSQPPSGGGIPMTDRTLTALYAQKSDAERARDDLASSGFGHDVDIHDQGGGAGSAEGGFMAKLKGFFGDHEDSHAYGEGLRRGHYLLTVKADDRDADDVAAILERSSAVDVDQAQAGWRQEGWSAPTAGGAYGAAAGMAGGATLMGTTSDRADDASYLANDAAPGRVDGEQVIPIVEERLVVGKREVDRGGVRVRSYVVETPVHEQVSLREEHVSIERRPVDRPASAGDDLFRDRDIQLTETAEEAVVAKDAVVREELVVRKDSSERTQEIDDTVRHTEVDVERSDGATSDRR